jgi:hypothetical protein
VVTFLNSSGSFGSYAGQFHNDMPAGAIDMMGFYIAAGLWKRSGVISDLDGDGRSDPVLGTVLTSGVGGVGGCFLGRDPSTTILRSSADLAVGPATGDTTSAATVSYVGDVNGDGSVDWAVGHTRHSTDRGRVVLVY